MHRNYLIRNCCPEQLGRRQVARKLLLLLVALLWIFLLCNHIHKRTNGKRMEFVFALWLTARYWRASSTAQRPCSTSRTGPHCDAWQLRWTGSYNEAYGHHKIGMIQFVGGNALGTGRRIGLRTAQWTPNKRSTGLTQILPRFLNDRI